MTNLKKPVVFAILMQNIMDKSPFYVLEKFDACLYLEKPETLLDSNNLKLLNEYLKKWGGSRRLSSERRSQTL